MRAYLESALALQGGKGLLACASQEPALEEAGERLKAAARAYLPVSHLLWGLWGLIQVPPDRCDNLHLCWSAHSCAIECRLCPNRSKIIVCTL